MITRLHHFFVSSDKYKDLYSLEISQVDLQEVTHMSVTQIQCGNFDQFTTEDIITLNEGGVENSLNYFRSTFNNFTQVANDLKSKLNMLSQYNGRNFTYDVTHDDVIRAFTITCDNSSMQKSINLINQPRLQKLFGFDPTNTFGSILNSFHSTVLYPTKNIIFHVGQLPLISYPLSEVDYYIHYDMLANSQEIYLQDRGIEIRITDTLGRDLSVDDWSIDIVLLKLEDFSKLNSTLDLYNFNSANHIENQQQKQIKKATKKVIKRIVDDEDEEYGYY